MSRTHHHYPRRFRTDKEDADFRRYHWKQHRQRVRELLRQELYTEDAWERIPVYKKTQGWFTW